MPRKVVIVGFAGVQALDVVGPYDVFTGASLLTGGGYEVVMASVAGQPVQTATGLAFVASPLPDPDDPIDTVVLPGGAGVDAARADAELVAWIKTVAGHARRIVTVCTGAFLAAEAGLLDGCRVTTHWAFAERLASEFPAIDVDPDPIFVRSSDDRMDRRGRHRGHRPRARAGRGRPRHRGRADGRPLARAVSAPTGRADPVRGAGVDAAGQTGLDPRGAGGDRGRTGWRRTASSDLARRAAMSPRHFTRVFTAEIGEAPGQYVERIRTEAARRQLEETDDTVVAIAAPVRLRHGGNHATQFPSPRRHLARPIPQGLRLT